MICPHCKSDEGSFVVDSRGQSNSRRRRYQCEGCHKRYSTYEVLATEYAKFQAIKINVSEFEKVIASLRAIKVQFGETNGTAKN